MIILNIEVFVMKIITINCLVLAIIDINRNNIYMKIALIRQYIMVLLQVVMLRSKI